MTTPPAPQGGLQLGPWLLEERLARGGMAEVWRGRRHAPRGSQPGSVGARTNPFLGGTKLKDVPRDAAVCIKRLDPALTLDPDFVEMFRDEARLVLGLQHDNVVKTWALYDDNPGGQPQELLLIMELVDGPSLARLTRALAMQGQGPPHATTTTNMTAAMTAANGPTLAESLTIALHLARALQHVHTHQEDGAPLSIVHRDVSPQNLLIDRSGRVVLIDFGVARAASRLTLTKKGTLKGKAAYMAPEQVRGEAVDGRVDQFAAAVVLWELLCHRPLFHGDNELRVLEQIARAEVVKPSIVFPDFVKGLEPRLSREAAREVARDVDHLVMKALAHGPAERFADMAAFAATTASILDTLGGPADLVPLVQRGLAAIEVSGRSSEQPTRTRVLETDPHRSSAGSTGDDVDDDERSADRADRVDHRARGRHPRGAPATWPLVVGACVVVGVVGVAVALAGGGDGGAGDARSDTIPGSDGGVVVARDVDDANADNADNAAADNAASDPAGAASRRIARVEQVLQRAPSHPCRTELLDELLERQTLTPALIDAIDQDAAACVVVARDAPVLRARLEKKNLLQPPPAPRLKKKQRSPTALQLTRRNDEITRRAKLALDAGASDAARALLEQVVSADPSRVDERRLLAEAYRRAGAVALAGVELRAFLQARPDDPERARLVRWLKRNDLPLP